MGEPTAKVAHTVERIRAGARRGARARRAGASGARPRACRPPEGAGRGSSRTPDTGRERGPRLGSAPRRGRPAPRRTPTPGRRTRPARGAAAATGGARRAPRNRQSSHRLEPPLRRGEAIIGPMTDSGACAGPLRSGGYEAAGSPPGGNGPAGGYGVRLAGRPEATGTPGGPPGGPPGGHGGPPGYGGPPWPARLRGSAWWAARRIRRPARLRGSAWRPPRLRGTAGYGPPGGYGPPPGGFGPPGGPMGRDGADSSARDHLDGPRHPLDPGVLLRVPRHAAVDCRPRARHRQHGQDQNEPQAWKGAGWPSPGL